MPARLTLFDTESNEPLDTIILGEIEEGANFAAGKPIRVGGLNTGDTHMRDISISATGEGANFVQLARDEDGEPGVWAAVGQSIMAHEGTLFRREEFAFWARGIFKFEDREGRYPLEFVIRGTSIG
jgi:hypothetical protein